MLDECKGDRLEEVLAVFSNAVLKKVLATPQSEDHVALAQQLALENFSYHGERTMLSALILAHKASLGKHLQAKEETRARYNDFSDLLDLNERRIARRYEQLKQIVEEKSGLEGISAREAAGVQNEARKNWSGNQDWLESILFSDSKANGDVLMATRFDKVWSHVENGSIGEVESKSRSGLLEQLDARVKTHENRLRRWQDFGRTISKSSQSPSKAARPTTKDGNKIDLGFTLHQELQIGWKATGDLVESNSASLKEYTRLIDNMTSELANVGKAQWKSRSRAQPGPRKSEYDVYSGSSVVGSPREEIPAHQDEGWSSASDSDHVSAASSSVLAKPTPQPPPSAPRTLRRGRQRLPDRSSTEQTQKAVARAMSTSSSPPRPAAQVRATPSPSPPRSRIRTPESMAPPPLPLVTKDSESDLADAILNSMSATSPSPKKQRHTLSLAERTRLSMSRVSHSQLSDLQDDFEIPDLPRLSIRPRPSIAPQPPISEAEQGLHEGLIERTRKSMVGFEAAQKKAQLERRRSVKEERKKVRQSSYFPKVDEEKETSIPDISAIELMEGDPDYESVFKSRPKIKTSPAVSPTRISEDSED
jgi:hypothetical protein